MDLSIHVKTLEHLEKADLIRVTQLEPELEYLFRHALVQDAAYSSLLKQDRRRLHEAVAHALEALNASRLDDIAAMLAYHFDAAGDVEQARVYYTRAGDAAAAHYANAEAAALYGSALALIPDSEPEAQIALLLKREQANDLQGARSDQQADLDRLAALTAQAGDPAQQAQAALRRSSYLAVISDYHAAIEAAQQAIGHAQRAHLPEFEAHGMLAQGIAEWHLAEFDAARVTLGAALTRARAAHLPDIEAQSLRNLGVVADYQEKFDEAQGYLEQALPVFQRLGNRRAEAQALNSLGIVSLNLGQLDEAQKLLGRALAIRQALGDLYGVGSTLANIAIVAQSQADFALVKQSMQESLAVCRAIGDREGEAAALDGLGVAASHYGQYALARQLYEQALPITREIDDSLGELSVLINLSAAAWRLRQLADAQALGEQALKLAREVGVPQRERYALLRMADAHQARDEGDLALALYEQVLTLDADENRDNVSIAALAGIARTRLASGDVAGAVQQIEPVMAYIAQGTDHDDNFLRLILTCCDVLRAADDPRSGEMLQAGQQRIQAEAARAPDAAHRDSYLNIPEHHALMSLSRP
jgi:tetratricopeptide (TPR) repeat protein